MVYPDSVSETVTNDVLGERLGNALELLKEVRDAVNNPENGLPKMNATLENHDARIRTLEQWHTWLLRTVMGAIILAGMSAIGFVWYVVSHGGVSS